MYAPRRVETTDGSGDRRAGEWEERAGTRSVWGPGACGDQEQGSLPGSRADGSGESGAEGQLTL